MKMLLKRLTPQAGFGAGRGEQTNTMSLDEIRIQIDTVDAELVSLLNRRAELSLEVGRSKAENPNARYFAPERERDVINRILELHAGGAMPKDALLAVFREIISASIALQMPMTIAYWGPRGTFTEMAARKRFGSVHPLNTTTGAASPMQKESEADFQINKII